MAFVFFWIMFTVLVGVTAHTRNRSAVRWVAGSLFITPLMALLFILVLGNTKKEVA